MVTINNEELRNVFHYLSAIDIILQKETRQIKGNKAYIDKIVPEHLTGTYSKKIPTALAFSDSITKTAYESAVVTLVATFERIVFAKYSTAYGTIKSVVKDHSPDSMDYYKARENLVSKYVDKLSGIIYLIEGYLDTDLLGKIKLLKDHRNYIAHGKRDVAAPAIEMRLPDIAKVLDDVIREIEL